MCPPTYLPVLGSDQQWTKHQRTIDRSTALEQWERLARAVETHLGPVKVQGAAPWAKAQTYTRDLGVAIDDVFVACEPVGPRGLSEPPLLANAIKDLDIAVTRPTGGARFDGGNVVVDHHDRVLIGLTSEVEADIDRTVDALRGVTSRTLAGVPLAGGRWPHLDMALCDLAGRGWLAYPPALPGFDLDDPVWHDLFAGQPVLIVEPEDSERLACNAVVTDTHVIGPHISSSLRSKIERLGFCYVALDLSELLKGGGGAHCLTLPLPTRTMLCQPSHDRREVPTRVASG